MNADERVIGRSGSYAKGVARRQEILQRATEVFAERGSTGTSLRRIAKEADVSHAALLHYFDSLEQLLLAVYEHATGRRAPDPQEASAVELLATAATENVAEPGIVQLYSTLLASSLESGHEQSAAFFSARFRHVRRDIAGRLKRDQAEGRVRDDFDPDELAALLVAASDGLQIQWLLQPDLDLEGILRGLDRFLAPTSSASPSAEVSPTSAKRADRSSGPSDRHTSG